jgi:hypothetical protein
MQLVLILLIMALSVVATGCTAGSLAGSAGFSNVASAIEAVGTTATGFKSAQSTVELNGANKQLVEAQAAMTEAQVNGAQADREPLGHERTVTARLLRDMSGEYNERVFLTLAEWVEAGGDPDFAFKYALAKIDNGSGVRELPQRTLMIGQPVESGAVKAVPRTTAKDDTSADEPFPELFPYWFITAAKPR